MKPQKTLDLLKELLNIPAPSGREEKMAEFIRGKIDKTGFSYKTDPAGNIIVSFPGKKTAAPTVMVAAHMDEIGMVVHAIEDNGDLKVWRSGGLYPWKIGECPVEIIGDKKNLTGLLSMCSAHKSDADQQNCSWESTRIVTGLTPEKLHAAGIRIGSTAVPATFVRGPVTFGDDQDPLVAAWTFDDRGGVLTLIRLLQQMSDKKVKPVNPLMICFTVHEEGGCHGAKVLANRMKPDIFIAIDGCPIIDEKVLKMDGRPGIWSKDAEAHYDQKLVKDLSAIAIKAGTELQPVVYDKAKSDASLVYSSGGAPRVAFVGHVRNNSHGYEVARLSCFDNVLKFYAKLVVTEIK